MKEAVLINSFSPSISPQLSQHCQRNDAEAMKLEEIIRWMYNFLDKYRLVGVQQLLKMQSLATVVKILLGSNVKQQCILGGILCEGPTQNSKYLQNKRKSIHYFQNLLKIKI